MATLTDREAVTAPVTRAATITRMVDKDSAGDKRILDDFLCTDGTRIPCCVRVSRRAKRRRLTLAARTGLEVVYPVSSLRGLCGISGLSQEEIKVFLEQQRPWIERTAKRIAPQREAYEASRAAGLPSVLEFPLAQELWDIEYVPTGSERVTARVLNAPSAPVRPTPLHRARLRLNGNIADDEACAHALRRFVSRRAQACIPVFAEGVYRELATTSGGAQLPPPRHITVNRRKTVWGTCSRDGTVRINERVLFFPAALAREVVLHEFAHLVVFDHSKRFYEQLLVLSGASRENEKALKHASLYVPAWMDG